MTIAPSLRIGVVIPALDEAAAVGGVVRALRGSVDEIIVVDNGSRDATAARAAEAGARVVREPRRGYGAACLAGIAALHCPDIVVFLDGDGADDTDSLGEILAPLANGQAELVIGARIASRREPGAMTLAQRVGNGLAVGLIRLIWGVRYADLGPFRAIRRDALEALAMADRDFGWTVEMQVKAAEQGLRHCDVPVGYRRRLGHSKISGTWTGVLRAGTKILWVIARHAIRRLSEAKRDERGLRKKSQSV